MKMFRKLLCTALVVAMIAATMLTAIAETRTFYMNGQNGNVFTRIYLDDVRKLASVKSSNKKVLVPVLVKSSNYNNHYLVTGQGKDNNGNSCEIGVKLVKPGTAKLTYKADGVAKSDTFKVLAYVNPVKSFVVSSVSSKNLASAFNRDGYNSGKLKKNTKAGKFIVVAKTGWVITDARWHDDQNDYGYSFYSWGRKGVSRCSVNIPAMKKGNNYYVDATLRNVKNGGTVDVTYWFN